MRIMYRRYMWFDLSKCLDGESAHRVLQKKPKKPRTKTQTAKPKDDTNYSIKAQKPSLYADLLGKSGKCRTALNGVYCFIYSSLSEMDALLQRIRVLACYL